MTQIGYVKVQKELKKKIIKGEYIKGDLLPSENKLSKQYGLSRMTIRHALKDLENEGLISRQQGKGSIVEGKRKSYELLSKKGFTEVMKGKEIKIDTELVKKPRIENWRENFYWNLTTEEVSAKCIVFSRTRTIDKKPIMFEKTYIPNIGMKTFCSKPFVHNSLFDTLLINHDIEITGVIQKFRAVTASEKVAKRLSISKGSPILEIVRKLATNRPDFFIYSFLYCNTDDFTIEA